MDSGHHRKSVPKIPDHSAVILKLETAERRGSGFWKLNTQCLENQDYKNGIINTINKTVVQYQNKISNRQLWDFCKAEIKRYSIRFSIYHSRLQKLEIDEIEKKIKAQEYFIANSDNFSHNDVKKLREELEAKQNDIYYQKVKGKEIRSRCKCLFESDKNPEFFKSLDQKHKKNNTITCLKNKNGEIVHKINDLLSCSRSFYEDLFSSQNIEDNKIDEYLSKINIPFKLSEDDKNICEGNITEEQCWEVIKKMQKNKSPGHDGLSVEFYQNFWQHVKKPLLNSFSEAYDNGELAYTHRESIISLMLKKGDRSELKNYCPLSLSNVDYKILAFALSSRVHKVLDKII